jgi:hypothetical protein
MDSSEAKKNFFFAASLEGYGGVVTDDMHWVGGTLSGPKTVRTERLWFVRYMAIIIGHFTMAMAL